MAVLATIKPKEDFIVQINGDYNVPFDEIVATAAGASGDVIAVGTKFGILAEDAVIGKSVRVMVRGNPTTVDMQALNFGALVVADTEAALAEQGIIVVNK